MSEPNGSAIRRHTLSVAVLAVFAMLLTVVTPVGPAGASPSEEAEFVAGVNAARAAAGLPALTVDNELIGLARGWTDQMKNGVCGEDRYICHASPISAGMTQDWAKLGENVGTGPDVGSVMDAFIASPGHYANIVDPEFTHIGVGVIRDPDNPARLYTTHRFMKLQNAPEPQPEPQPEPAETPAEPEVDEATEVDDEPESAAEPESPAEPTAPTDDVPETPEAPSFAPPPVSLDRAEVVVRALSRVD